MISLSHTEDTIQITQMSIIYNLKLSLRKLTPRGFVLWTHKARAVIAAAMYGFPAGKITAIGIAGTKGKTTTTNLVTRILEEAGFKVAMFSTANLRFNGKESLNTVKLTTPSPFFLSKILADAVAEKFDYAVIEVSSHALDQHRLWDLDFKTVVVTNLMPDHLDYHKVADHYRDTHLKMITSKTETLVINGEESESSILRRRLAATEDKQKLNFKTVSFGLDKTNDLVADNVVLSESEVKFNANLKGKNLGEFALKMPGKFNVYNALAAIGAGVSLGIDTGKIKKALEKVSGVPGRLESINVSPKQDFTVIVDYAHSPDSIRNLYEAIKPYAKAKFIAVLGGTGDRDKTYRAKVGILADSFADIVVITNEDPYSEDPEAIMDQVLAGIKNKTMNKNLFRILDRKEAIAKAVEIAGTNDIILITGKGSEQFMIWGEKRIPWDDREKAREVLKKKFSI